MGRMYAGLQHAAPREQGVAGLQDRMRDLVGGLQRELSVVGPAMKTGQKNVAVRWEAFASALARDGIASLDILANDVRHTFKSSSARATTCSR